MDALQVLVQQGARGGEAERAGLDALADQRRHLGDLVGVGHVVGVAALAQHIGAHRGVRHLGADVDGARLGFQRVEVFGEALPLPVDALGQRRAGDVLDAFHQLDQELVVASGRTGAKPTPQLPMIAVVTPCQLEGASSGSQVAWPS